MREDTKLNERLAREEKERQEELAADQAIMDKEASAALRERAFIDEQEELEADFID